MTASFQNVVLTGACGGLGQALARELIGQGAALALVGLNRPVLETLATLAPKRCAVYTPDVTDTTASARSRSPRLNARAVMQRS